MIVLREKLDRWRRRSGKVGVCFNGYLCQEIAWIGGLLIGSLKLAVNMFGDGIQEFVNNMDRVLDHLDHILVMQKS